MTIRQTLTLSKTQHFFDFDGKVIPSVDVYKHSSSSKEEVNIQTTSDEKNVKTRIENNTDSTKKVSVIVIGYDENNVINSVQNVSKRSKRKYGRDRFGKSAAR